jgi:ADP-ribose pyrophosphatase
MWKKISSNVIFKHPRVTLIEDVVELPDGAKTTYLKLEAKNDSSTIICEKNGEVLLQKEYSYPPNEELFQFPGGKIEPNESNAEGAMRELIEEAGLKPGNFREIGWYYVDNRRTSAKMHVFLATECVEVEKKGGDTEEVISDFWTPIAKVDEMIKTGKIVNYSVLAAWSLFKLNK